MPDQFNPPQYAKGYSKCQYCGVLTKYLTPAGVCLDGEWCMKYAPIIAKTHATKPTTTKSTNGVPRDETTG